MEMLGKIKDGIGAIGLMSFTFLLLPLVVLIISVLIFIEKKEKKQGIIK